MMDPQRGAKPKHSRAAPSSFEELGPEDCWELHWARAPQLHWVVILTWLCSGAPRAVELAPAGGQARVSLLMCPLVHHSPAPALAVGPEQPGAGCRAPCASSALPRGNGLGRDVLGRVQQFSPL